MHGFAIFVNAEKQTKRHGEWRDGKRIAWLSSGGEGATTGGSPIKVEIKDFE
jgi:hypothetical protein